MSCKLLRVCSAIAAAAALLSVVEVEAGRSPHADEVLAFSRSAAGARYSSNVYEDAMLDVPGLISKYGYPVESHAVRTEDGYLLTVHRIPHGRDAYNRPGPRPAVFLMHGLLASSADFVVLGPGRALSYLLAEAGYDVWIGNARGNYYSRAHESISPEKQDFWMFSWEEIGMYDLAAIVDHIITTTGEKQVHYVGHSQGGTTFLVLNSMRPEYNAKFKSFQGFAPASYFTHNQHDTFKQLARFEKIIETAALALGVGEIMSKQESQALLNSDLCNGLSLFDPVCVAAIQDSSSAVAGFNSTMVPLFLAHAPAGASIRQVAHYGQVIRRDSFARFHHSPLANLLRYGRATPPEYNMARVTVPTVLYYGLADEEVHYRDLLTLAANLGNTVMTVRALRPQFNHYDFIWGDRAKEELYDTVIQNIRMFD